MIAGCCTAAVLASAGCTGLSTDSGFDAVARRAGDAVHADVAWPRSIDEESKTAQQIAALLQHPLTAQDAIQVALLANRGLRGAFEDLKISEADLVQSGRLANPRFDLRHASIAGQYDIEETLSFNVLSLLTLPYARSIEAQRFSRTQDRVVLAVAQLADATRIAFYSAVAARETLEYQRQVQAAANAGGELAVKMMTAGNWNALDGAHERAFALQASQDLAQADRENTAAHEKLARLLGVTAFQLTQGLPDLPPAIDELPDVEQAVLGNRIDLQLQRSRLDELARRLRLTRATRFVNVLDAGPTRVLQGTREQPYEKGYDISLEIPIFDSGAARMRKAEALYGQAAQRYAQAAIEARSDIRQAHAIYKAAYATAVKQHDEILPLIKSVVEQDLLRYNASLLSVFDLLADVREQIAGAEVCIRQTRDFWIAKSALDSALLGTLQE